MSAVGWFDRRALLQQVDESEMVALYAMYMDDVAIDGLDVRVAISGMGQIKYSLDCARKLLVGEETRRDDW